ncbi:MAG: TonB-dependent receptor plug domain-containing protein [Candidatus Acidiferrales bacterium]
MLVLLLSCQQAWSQTPQATQPALPQASPQTQQAPQTPPPPSPQTDLTQVSIENLMNMEVTSVSKKEQKLSRAAAAIFVITQEDIRRSGAMNIPDLLRMVPGLQVAQINSSTWAITARGFDGQYSNKLLVLVDGRTMYSPIFSGTFWDTQSLLLDNIDLIEVIRGPGATVWGANAVNGVINITTRKAADTQGGLLTAGGGTSEQGFGRVRYGGSIGSATSYRVEGGAFNWGQLPNLAGQNGEDDWHNFQGGFRMDARASPKDSLTLEGDAYSGNKGEMVDTITSISPPVNGILSLRDRFSGWDVVSSWDHVASPHSETNLEINFEHRDRGDTTYGTGLSTLGIDFEHHVGWGKRQDFVWGLGYLLTTDEMATTLRIAFTPRNQTRQLFSSFVQDEIALLPDKLYLTLGAKLEHNDFTGFGWQPSVRVAWIANKRNMFWAAVSRALRTPSQSDRDIRVNQTVLPGPNNLPVLISIFGSPTRQDERLNAFEAGYRTEVTKRISFDGTAFYNDYDSLVSVEPGAPFLEATPPTLHLVVPNVLSNLVYGETHGVELSVDWKVTKRWTLSPGYSFLAMHLHRAPTSQDRTTISGTQGAFPSQQAQLRLHLDLGRHWQWNASAYFVGRLSAQAIPSYTRLDTNVIWKPGKRFSISLVGQNLLRDDHLEFFGPSQTEESSLIKRSAYAEIRWQF